MNNLIEIYRAAVNCNVCFASPEIQRGGIDMAQPWTVGSNYRPGGIAIIALNPGAGNAPHREARYHALRAFRAGDDSAIAVYQRAAETDIPQFWNARLVARLDALKLAVKDVVFGNIALCAARDSKGKNTAPESMLSACWLKHSRHMLRATQPGTAILMGNDAQGFSREFSAEGVRVIGMRHFAALGKALKPEVEAAECARVLALLKAAA
jgi:hypothetical protein